MFTYPPPNLPCVKTPKLATAIVTVLKDSGPPALFALLYPPHGFIVPPVNDLGLSRGQIPPQDRSFFVPLNLMHPEALSMAPLLFTYSHNTLVGACSVHMHATSSLALSPSSHRHPRLLGLITGCRSISGSTPLLSCAKARWFVSCELVSRFSF